jgi:hypothetical protein
VTLSQRREEIEEIEKRKRKRKRRPLARRRSILRSLSVSILPEAGKFSAMVLALLLRSYSKPKA